MEEMEKVKARIDEFWEAAKNTKGGIEEHRKLSHMGKGIRFGMEVLRTEDTRKKIQLYKERMDLQFKERYGEIEMKSS